MKFGVVIFPGSNCDEDMIYVLQDIMEQEVVRLWHKETNIEGKSIIKFANKGGFVFGVCNGFQILCEAGLLPGALLANKNQKFVCKNTYIKADNNNTKLTAKLQTNRAIKIPIAHAEGRFYAPDKVITEMRKNEQILFRYCNKYGELSEDFNPNGSIENIAGICNKNKNVFGMMPHPERASDEELGNTDGKIIFESIISSFTKK